MQLFQRLLRDAGLRHKRRYDLRHCVATHLLAKSVELRLARSAPAPLAVALPVAPGQAARPTVTITASPMAALG